MKHKSSLSVLLLLTVCGCAEGAKLVQDKDDGGVVVYPYRADQGPLLSAQRKEALILMQTKCGGPYTIVREGEAKSRARLVGLVPGAEEVVRESRWGIQFECK